MCYCSRAPVSGFAVCSAGVYIASILGPRGQEPTLVNEKKNKKIHYRVRGQISALVLIFVCKRFIS